MTFRWYKGRPCKKFGCSGFSLRNATVKRESLQKFGCKFGFSLRNATVKRDKNKHGTITAVVYKITVSECYNCRVSWLSLIGFSSPDPASRCHRPTHTSPKACTCVPVTLVDVTASWSIKTLTANFTASHSGSKASGQTANVHCTHSKCTMHSVVQSRN